MKRFFQLLPHGILTVLILLVILYLTLMPDPLPDTHVELFAGADKVVHAIMFAALAGAIVLDMVRFRRVDRLSAGVVAAIVVVASLAGGGIELLQGTMNAGRSCDFYDFVADAVGAVAGALVALPIARWLSAGKDCGE
ncbi:MAG: VanZ family protein [Clostridiales bacterium]|nr:VanZ family protein [Clostridiales bacterium]